LSRLLFDGLTLLGLNSFSRHLLHLEILLDLSSILPSLSSQELHEGLSQRERPYAKVERIDLPHSLGWL